MLYPARQDTLRVGDRMAASRLVRVVTTALTVTAGAYSTGQCVGGLKTLDLSNYKDALSILLQSVTLVDQAKQSIGMDLIVFDSNPSGTTFTDNATLDMADADMSKILAVVPITSYASFNDNSVGYAANLSLPIMLDPTAPSTPIYTTIVARGAPTFAATTDLVQRLGFMSL